MALTFEQSYTTDIYKGLEGNQRVWYDPLIQRWMRKASLYRELVPVKRDFSPQARTTRTVIYNMKFGLEPMTNAAGRRDLYTNPMVSGSAQVPITTERHVGKIQLHQEDENITYWEANPGNAGLAALVSEDFGPALTAHQDRLARDAYLMTHYYNTAAGSKWVDIGAGDTFELGWAHDLRLMRSDRMLGDWQDHDVLMLTTPGGMHALESSSAYQEERKYTESGYASLHSAVSRRYRGVQFAEAPANVLWNAGAITKQVAITAPAPALSGGSDWGPYTINGKEDTLGYISVSDFTAGQFKVNDKVSIGKRRALVNGTIAQYVVDGSVSRPEFAASGVPFGNDPFDGWTFERTVKFVDTTPGACKIGFEEPLNWDYTENIAALTNGKRDGTPAAMATSALFQSNGVDVTAVYGYITKAINIHCSLVVYGLGAVACGVTYMPRIRKPRPVDDFESIFRLTYDFQMGYRPYMVKMAHVIYHAGAYNPDGILRFGA